MKYYIGNTDHEWFNNLKDIKPEDINFWQPSGHNHFRAVEPNSPFLFRLKNPINKIGGVGFFTSHSILPINFAWDVFGNRNGTKSYSEFRSKIFSYRNEANSIEENPNIGCIVLTNPIFFNENDWVEVPRDWARNIVQGRTYSTEDEMGRRYWSLIQNLILAYTKEVYPDMVNESTLQYRQSLTSVRIGQGAFRILVTDAYLRRCTITGERTLPVLEAAHIKPYSKSGLNEVKNGLLLRADVHKLFDLGYVTINEEYHVEVSKKIKEEYENGRDYYKYHGHKLVSLPNNIDSLPSKEMLRWHNECVFKD